MSVYQAYAKAFVKCVSDYFGDNVLPTGMESQTKECKIAVVGRVCSGRSTLINALAGKNILETTCLPTAPIFKVIRNGNDEDCVRIVYKDGRQNAIFLNEFRDKFPLHSDDYYDELCNFFDDVAYAETHDSGGILNRGICFIEVPGIESLYQWQTDDIMKRSDIIIFVLNATALTREKDFIQYFSGKEMRNVFFVVNRVNQLPESSDLEFVVSHVRAGLENVFTDKSGKFDEELYNERVFFINAYGAMCARTGELYKVMVGGKGVEVEVRQEDTGILGLEDAILDYVDENRCGISFSQMTQIYFRLLEETEKELKKDNIKPQNYSERIRNISEAPKIGALQAMREYIGYCFEDLYGHQPTDLELRLLA